uniref:Uncharacterized protein n=1 Tax=Craspedostauros australis TaxID=1486917 RepID=A0A7R9WU93_9STRA
MTCDTCSQVHVSTISTRSLDETARRAADHLFAPCSFSEIEQVVNPEAWLPPRSSAWWRFGERNRVGWAEMGWDTIIDYRLSIIDHRIGVAHGATSVSSTWRRRAPPCVHDVVIG